MRYINVTKDVDWELPDDEYLPITRCVCGAKYTPWDFTISIYPFEDSAGKCRACGAMFHFVNSITVFQIKADNAE
jgi:hypothetical protein